jgi:hypothetical protein
MGDFLLWSLILSIVLTTGVNVGPRLFPGLARKARHRIEDTIAPPDPRERPEDRGRVRVIIPWRTMLAVSVVVTLALNLVLVLR